MYMSVGRICALQPAYNCAHNFIMKGSLQSLIVKSINWAQVLLTRLPEADPQARFRFRKPSEDTCLVEGKVIRFHLLQNQIQCLYTIFSLFAKKKVSARL